MKTIRKIIYYQNAILSLLLKGDLSQYDLKEKVMGNNNDVCNYLHALEDLLMSGMVVPAQLNPITIYKRIA